LLETQSYRLKKKIQYTIELDSPNLIEGLAEALKSMTKNEKARVWIKSDYGYGAKGNKQLNVPPNANLIYEIELQSFENEKPSSDLKESEKIERGQKRKDLGNVFFKADNNRRAVKAYEGVISLFSDLLEFKEEKAKASALKATAYANVAAVKLKEKDWSAVIEQSTKALELDQKNPKVLFRRAQAQAHRGENPLALEDIKQALEIEPTNAPVIKLRNAIQSRITKQKEKEKNYLVVFLTKSSWLMIVNFQLLPPPQKMTKMRTLRMLRTLLLQKNPKPTELQIQQSQQQRQVVLFLQKPKMSLKSWKRNRPKVKQMKRRFPQLQKKLSLKRMRILIRKKLQQQKRRKLVKAQNLRHKNQSWIVTRRAQRPLLLQKLRKRKASKEQHLVGPHVFLMNCKF